MTQEELAKRLATRIFELGAHGRGLVKSELESLIVEELKLAEKSKPADNTTVNYRYGVV